MIVDSKTAENAEAPRYDQSNSERTEKSFPSPQLNPSEINGGPSNTAYTAPSYAPPAYAPEGGSVGSRGSAVLGRGQSHETHPVPTTPNPGHPYATLSPSNTPVAEPFSRHAPQQLYPHFKPTFLAATGQYLTRGFPAVPPPSTDHPHPFASHDVTELDWLRFLHEVKTSGELTERQEHFARLPIVSILPIVGPVSTHLIRQQMKKGKSKDVATVVNTWNHHFFNPRHMEVALMHGITRLSGNNKHNTSHGQSTPGWSGSSTIQSIVDDSNTGKGKAKEEEDTTYRLFIMPLYTNAT